MTDGQPLCRSFFQNGSEEPSASRMAALMAELINQSERAAEWQGDAWGGRMPCSVGACRNMEPDGYGKSGDLLPPV